MVTARRKGTSQVANVPTHILAQLNAGEIESATLSENVATDFTSLMAAVFPSISAETAWIAPNLGITKRMIAAAKIIYGEFEMAKLPWLATHRSDLVRGWGAYLIALDRARSLEEKIATMLPFADDPHFGVQEWSWLALRPEIVAEPKRAIAALTPLARHESEYLRRFASEATRPRGVWAPHIKLLKETPRAGLPILEKLRADPSRYVQDSVANWLNDAWKSQPDWVEALCDNWLVSTDAEATFYIVKRALRNRNAQ